MFKLFYMCGFDHDFVSDIFLWNNTACLENGWEKFSIK